MKESDEQDFSASSNSTRSNVVIHGLEKFFKKLEKDFFAEVSIQGLYYSDTRKTDLIVDFYCNFSITDSFRFFADGNWGGSYDFEEEDGKTTYSFHKAFQKMKEENSDPVDIKEISFHFEGTSIIISRIYEYSIPEQMNAILSEMKKHLLHLTKGETQIPYEIFIPVFEERKHKAHEFRGEQIADYLEYWGVYIDNDRLQNNPMIYDLSTKELRCEDFFLL